MGDVICTRREMTSDRFDCSALRVVVLGSIISVIAYFSLAFGVLFDEVSFVLLKFLHQKFVLFNELKAGGLTLTSLEKMLLKVFGLFFS